MAGLTKEFVQDAISQFQAVDGNRDGQLTWQEIARFEAYQGSRSDAKADVQEGDADGDGKVSLVEIAGLWLGSEGGGE